MGIETSAEILRGQLDHLSQQITEALGGAALRSPEPAEGGEPADIDKVEANLLMMQDRLRDTLAEIRSAQRLMADEKVNRLIEIFADRVSLTPEEAVEILAARGSEDYERIKQTG